jgi:hypothetical protein
MRTALFSFCIAVAACGGKTNNDAPSPNGGDGGVTPDSGLAEGCPPASTEGPCSKEGLLCEYGSDYNPQCNTVRVCSGGRWSSPITFGGTPKCPSGGPPTYPPNPDDCAGTRAGVPDGMSCSSKSTCNYDGAVCSCGVFCSNYPIRMPDCDPDAGITTSCCDTTKVAWHCFDGPKYCATNRPKIGTPCKAGDACAFDVAVECGQSRMECRDGVWQIGNTSCPVSTAAAKDDIVYVTPADAEYLRRELMKIPLATYRYKGQTDHHLGFVIEDLPPTSPAVLPSRDRVDLYGYLSMAVAAIQRQDKEIAALKAQIAELKKGSK